MPISVNGANGITFADGSIQNTGAAGFGFKNRVINGAMVINQRSWSGNITTGTSITYPTTGLLLSGGACGGGGIAAAGQNITAPASQTTVYDIFQTIIGGSNGLSGLDGSSGIELYQPLLSTGGSGGGSSNSAIDSGGSGGNGGAGGFGSGGGGGGAGPTSTTISSTNLGGKGGSGLVIINCW
jgi:hypothetical protein